MARLSRRSFLRLSATGIGGAILAACGATPTPTPAPTPTARVVEKEVTKVVEKPVTQVVERQVTQIVEKAVEKIVVATPTPVSLKGTELLLWIDAQLAVAAAKTFLQATNQTWAQENGVKYREVETSGGMGGAEQVAAWMAAKSGPNLYLAGESLFVSQAMNMEDVGALATELGERLGGWFDGPKSLATSYKGQWRGIPAWVFGQYWHYREDQFKQLGYDGFPKTWEKLREAGAKAKKQLNSPVGFGLGPCGSDSHVNIFSLLWSFGGKFFNPDGSIGIDTKEALGALEWFKGFWDDACKPEGIAWDCGGNNQAYNSKQICCTNNAISIYVGAKTQDPELAKVTGVAGALAGPAGTFHYQSQLVACIPSYAKDKPTVLAYLRNALYDTKTQIALTKAGEGYNLPPFKALQTIEAAWPVDPKEAMARNLVEGTASPGYAGPLTPAVGKLMSQSVFLDMFASVASGKKTPKEAIAWVVAEMKRIMA